MLAPWRGQADLPEADALLIHAYSLYQASLCPACGRPLVECRDPDNAGRFDIETDICHAMAAMEEWRDGEGKEAPGGAVPYPVLAGERAGRSSQAQLLAAAKLAAGQGGDEGNDPDA